MMDERLTMREWPKAERPYEKLECQGPSSLTEAELIAIILSSGRSGQTSVDLALKLLKQVENIGLLNQASLEELQTVSGIGRVKAIRLKAAVELGQRVNNYLALTEPAKLGGVSQAILHFTNQMKLLPREEFHVALLNLKHDLIRTIQVTTGNISSIELDPREIFREAIRSNAAGIILAHNHPSGDPSPSSQDIKTTKAIVAMGKDLRISVLDHIIVGAKASVSLREEGYM